MINAPHTHYNRSWSTLLEGAREARAHRAGDLRRENPSTEKDYLTYTYYDDTYTQNATSMCAFRCKLDIVADSMVLWSANYLYIVLYLHPE